MGFVVDIENIDGRSVLLYGGRKCISKCFTAVSFAEGVNVSAGRRVASVARVWRYINLIITITIITARPLLSIIRPKFF